MPQSCVRSFSENYVQSYHLVRRLKKLCVKFVPAVLKDYPINSWFEKLCVNIISIIKVMLKKCYFVATLKKYHLIFVFKKLNTYIRINYLKVKKEIYLERKQASYDSWRLARADY